MAKIFVSDLKADNEVEDVFSVKYKHPIKNYTNGFMFRIGLSDKSGEVEATYFGSSRREDVDKIYGSFKVNDVVHLKGYCKIHDNKKVININEGRGILRKAEENEYDLAHFIHASNQDIERLYSYVKEKADSIRDPYL
jgi:hypothetical protein